jgi:hypothetical protein
VIIKKPARKLMSSKILMRLSKAGTFHSLLPSFRKRRIKRMTVASNSCFHQNEKITHQLFYFNKTSCFCDPAGDASPNKS